MTQTLAIFHDAYRGLKARKMFWIVLAISFLIVACFACIGITDQGLKLLVWELSFGPTTAEISPALFYKTLFVSIGVGTWLSWAAAILALISTAGIFPAFIAKGSIELVVSRPMSRLRLFLTQYAGGLLFVMLQITIFCLTSFLVIGLRGRAWEPGIFLAIPLVTCFFSYLFSVCVLLGLLTRSAVAALLLTILFWFFLFVVNSADSGLLMFTLQAQEKRDLSQRQLQETQDQLAALADDAENPSTEQEKLEARVTNLHAQYQTNASTASKLNTAHRVVYGIKSFLPKAGETVNLLERVLIKMAELPVVKEADSSDNPSGPGPSSNVGKKLVETFRRRSVWWILGTSLAFEACILALGAWVFCRRNF